MKPNSGPKVAANAVIAFDRQVIAKTLRDYAKPTSLIASDAINGGEPSRRVCGADCTAPLPSIEEVMRHSDRAHAPQHLAPTVAKPLHWQQDLWIQRNVPSLGPRAPFAICLIAPR